MSGGPQRARMQLLAGRLPNWAASIGLAVTRVGRHLLTNRPHAEIGFTSGDNVSAYLLGLR